MNDEMNEFSPDINEALILPSTGNWPEAAHCFSTNMVAAIQAALLANRPLLIRGEPGLGKSQLARAAAVYLKRLFISVVVNANTEAEDLQWHFDALGRLGDAHVGFVKDGDEKKENYLKPEKYLSPGPLWWTFNYESAALQYKKAKYRKLMSPSLPKFDSREWIPSDGCVLLIDEIDKAEPELPNGLLETLGNGAFSVPYCDENQFITMTGKKKPLVIFTTNEERQLPKAFLRRCLVLKLAFPESIEGLVKIGRAHFGGNSYDSVYQLVAESIFEDRKLHSDPNAFKPGQAEFIDILRVLTNLSKDEKVQILKFEKVKDYCIKKM